ncbi:hypothetical protein [Halioxenophilus sp. WMMB6]|uniref:hypothetical protein n=1 Tax=Halioxenophilus sp. WMMB6 TaxID=3073815 RepID=UPI00295F07E2|nr:hypothetical protein [Halioxenophilus sp. WMMB6]
MAYLVSVAISVLVFALVLWLLLNVKTPRYRVSASRVQQLLEQVLVGQANANDWQVFLAYEIRDNPELERIRRLCLAIDERESRTIGDYVLSERGRQRVAKLLPKLAKLINDPGAGGQ